MADNTNKDTDKRSYFLPRTRCTEKERLAIEAKAKKAGLSLSEYQRRALLKAVVNVRHSALDAQAMKLLHRMSANLNQLVKSAHIHHAVDRQHLTEIHHHIEALTMEVINDS